MDFINGLLFGMMLQLMVGPVCLAVLHTSLQRGFGAAFRMSVGVALVDAFYIGLSFTGVSWLLQAALLRRVILIAGAAVLAYFGVRYLLAAGKVHESRSAAGDPFVYGIKLTLINPLSIVFWGGTFGSLLASGSVRGSVGAVLFSAGCVIATLLFLGLVSLGGGWSSRFLKPSVMKCLNFGVGLALVCFAVGMLFK